MFSEYIVQPHFLTQELNTRQYNTNKLQFWFAGFDDSVFPYNNMGYSPGNGLVMNATDQFVMSGSLQPVTSV